MQGEAKQLANGLQLTVDDQSRVYFGDYHRVRLVVTAQMPLHSVVELTSDDRNAAEKRLGCTLTHSRVLEQMGVCSSELESVKSALLQHFYSNSLPYLAAPDFPVRLVRSLIRRTKQAHVQPTR